jgi:small subunit ribosomal protein S6
MPDSRIYTYEVMFLIGQAQAADLTGVIEHINELFARSGAEVLAMRKWDERRLAYEIRKQKRGLYILAYIEAPGRNLSQFERDCNLSERILRTMVLRADHLTPEEILAQDARGELETEARLRATRATEQDEPEAVAVPPETEAEEPEDDELED